MRSSSRLQIGAFMSESYCERTLRAAGHIVSEGNTLLSSLEVVKLTILRINREYMEYMRANFAHIIHDQKFNTTVVSPTMDPPMDPPAPSPSGSSRVRPRGAGSSTDHAGGSSTDHAGDAEMGEQAVEDID